MAGSGIPAFDDLVGGTLGNFTEHVKDELKNIEVKDITDLIVTLGDMLPGDSLAEGIEEINNILERSQEELEQQDISTEQLAVMVTSAWNLAFEYWHENKMANSNFQPTPFDLLPRSLSFEYKKLIANKPSDIKSCNILIGAGIILLAVIFRKRDERNAPMAEYLIKSATTMAKDACAIGV